MVENSSSGNEPWEQATEVLQAGVPANVTFCEALIEDGLFYRTQILDADTIHDDPDNPQDDPTTYDIVPLPNVLGPEIMFGGSDQRVPIARVTTAGDVCLAMNFQIRPEGLIENPYPEGTLEFEEWEQAQDYRMEEPLCIENPCRQYQEQTPSIVGNALNCPGTTADVEVGFLGGENLTSDQIGFVLTDAENDTIANGQGPLVFQGLSAGNYVLYTEDFNTCKDTVEIEVISPDPIEAMPSIGDQNRALARRTPPSSSQALRSWEARVI